MKITHTERVKKGTKSLDIAAQKGKLDKNWRYILNLKTLRTYYWINNPLDQLFGSTSIGLNKTGGFGFAEEHGFLNYTDVRKYPNDATLLKETWRHLLRTEEKWTKKDNGAYTRIIKGLGYTIYWCSTRKQWGVVHQLNSLHEVGIFPVHYKTSDSAKRAVLKYHQKLTKMASVASSD